MPPNVRLLAVVIVCLIVLIGFGGRYYVAHATEKFHFKVYPGLSDVEVIQAVGQPSRIFRQTEADALSAMLEDRNYAPRPDLPIRKKVFVFRGPVARLFLVYFDEQDRVTGVVTTQT